MGRLRKTSQGGTQTRVTLKGNRVVFNIKGNTYRLIVSIAYRSQVVYIKFFGTHAEYDKIDALSVNDF
ncbi:type II toxin-antitoxin system HigB family toxin [Lujinxingia sediminis]|uniref:type II toxin-antitoxin system HigB family toxin n=1 Tax=Lujinxingia sediminis TaxID=2480984 RepID=UPI0019D1982D